MFCGWWGAVHINNATMISLDQQLLAGAARGSNLGTNQFIRFHFIPEALQESGGGGF
jgi:hypothetical protein